MMLIKLVSKVLKTNLKFHFNKTILKVWSREVILKTNKNHNGKNIKIIPNQYNWHKVMSMI
jgi:hypothetical protein